MNDELTEYALSLGGEPLPDDGVLRNGWFFHRPLTLEQAQKFEGLMSAKAGISHQLADGHPYKTPQQR